MAQSKKKVISTSTKDSKSESEKYVSSSKNSGGAELLYGKDFYIWMLIGLGCIILGFILMAGGNQAPNEWNPDEIYSFRRTALAPIVILIGLGIEVYAIFKK